MQLTKPTSRGQAVGFIFGTIALANILSTWVLDANLRAMVYPIDADTIMIPIANNFLNSLYILAWGTTGALLPRHHIIWRIASRTLLLIAGTHTWAMGMYWWYPSHYLAGASFFLPVIACAWALCLPVSKRAATPCIPRTE